MFADLKRKLDLLCNLLTLYLCLLSNVCVLTFYIRIKEVKDI